ncbi:MAG: hypothetical protein IH586_12455 [Anaerolineaceae bacterium]|nr:hypothetical protein [Anaerolineaceae bacterium]
MGDYVSAADLFENVAERAKMTHPRQISRLLIEAGRARIFGGQVDAGMRLLTRGLQVLAGQERWADLHRMGTLVVDGLRQRDFTEQADEIQDWFNRTLGQQAASRPKENVQRAPLPPKCPYCIGHLDPREIEWVSEDTVECAFCGSLVRGREG